MRAVKKVVLKVKLYEREDWHVLSLPPVWGSIEVLKALVDGMVTQGHYAELHLEISDDEVYRGPAELVEEMAEGDGNG
jgi:hypothetical protein